MIDWESLPSQGRISTANTAVTGKKFDNPNSVVWRGGAILIQEGPNQVTKVERCYFKNCQNMESIASGATDELGGGAISMRSGKLECTTCYFQGCQARVGNGGAIISIVDVTLSDCNFTECITKTADKSSGKAFGGAIYCQPGNVVLTECFFEKCKTNEAIDSAPCCGGAVFSLSIEASFCGFSECVARNGGAITVGWDVGSHAPYGKKLSLANCTISDCEAKSRFNSCGAIEAYGDIETTTTTSPFEFTMEGCTIVRCSAN